MSTLEKLLDLKVHRPIIFKRLATNLSENFSDIDPVQGFDENSIPDKKQKQENGENVHRFVTCSGERNRSIKNLYLKPEQEDILLSQILERLSDGSPTVKKNVLVWAKHISGSKREPSQQWFDNFLKRNPVITLRDRRICGIEDLDVGIEGKDAYLRELHRLVKAKGPSVTIWNAEATIFTTTTPSSVFVNQPEPLKILEIFGQLRLLGCVSSHGQALPPFFVLSVEGTDSDRDRCKKEGITDATYEVDDSIAEETHNNWTTISSVTFHAWFEKCFLPHIEEFCLSAGPNILILGHHWHVDVKTINMACEHNVDIFIEPATGSSRPVSVIRNLFEQVKFKQEYSQVLLSDKFYDNEDNFSLWTVPLVLKYPWEKAIERKKIIESWNFSLPGIGTKHSSQKKLQMNFVLTI
jgi:hypothetical protein